MLCTQPRQVFRGTRCLAHLLPHDQEDQVTQGQILSQSPTDVTRFWWHLYGS